MTLQHRLIILYLSLVLPSCLTGENCPPNINQLPEYGGQKKCLEQINIDNQFISASDSMFKDRKTAAKYYIKRAWDYFDEGKADTSMMRFNQAWMLDSNNADIYWGFGNILGTKRQFKESIPFFEKSIKINSSNPRVFECISKSYGQLFVQDTIIEHLDKAISYLKTSISMDSNNPRAYGQLTALYVYFMQKDSARKYLEITDRLDSSMVNPEVREILTRK